MARWAVGRSTQRLMRTRARARLVERETRSSAAIAPVFIHLPVLPFVINFVVGATCHRESRAPFSWSCAVAGRRRRHHLLGCPPWQHPTRQAPVVPGYQLVLSSWMWMPPTTKTVAKSSSGTKAPTLRKKAAAAVSVVVVAVAAAAAATTATEGREKLPRRRPRTVGRLCRRTSHLCLLPYPSHYH